MTLYDITELVTNNKDCVVIKLKANHEMDLIALGCFNGDETMFRLTKGEDVTCTVFKKNGTHFSWDWGFTGYTLVTQQVREQGRMIQNCVERYYGIKCQR